MGNRDSLFKLKDDILKEAEMHFIKWKDVAPALSKITVNSE